MWLSCVGRHEWALGWLLDEVNKQPAEPESAQLAASVASARALVDPQVVTEVAPANSFNQIVRAATSLLKVKPSVAEVPQQPTWTPAAASPPQPAASSPSAPRDSIEDIHLRLNQLHASHPPAEHRSPPAEVQPGHYSNMFEPTFGSNYVPMYAGEPSRHRQAPNAHLSPVTALIDMPLMMHGCNSRGR